MARIAGVDIPREKKVPYSLCYIHGIGLTLAKKICSHAKVDEEKRVKDFPAAESLMTQAGVGAALAGQRVLLVHIRIDFMIYSLDSIVNWLSMWRFKSNRESNVPVVIRAIVGRGWGQGPQHSQSLETLFSSIPGLKVVCPSNARDAKGLLIQSIRDDDPVIFLEHITM